MRGNRFIRLIALMLALCLLLSALPASAATLEKLTALRGVAVKGDESATAKHTTRLAPPKKISLTVGQVKRVNLKLKYKVTPDQILYNINREDRALPAIVNNELFVLGIDTGDALLTLLSGTKSARTNIVIKSRPVTGIQLEGDLLRANQYEAYNLATAVIPFSASGLVKWSSDRSSVAKVTARGGLTCRKPGTAVLTCKTRQGSKLVGSVLVIVS